MCWTVIYSTLENGVESFIMTSFHDGKFAWTDAKEKLTARLGPERSFSLYALVKGGNPIYTEVT
jgi:hypothetical protein